MIVAVGMPNATEVPLSLDDGESDTPLQHTLGSYHSYHSTANDGNIDMAPGHWLGLLWAHHLNVYSGALLPSTRLSCTYECMTSFRDVPYS